MSEDLKKGMFMGTMLGAAILGGGVLIGYHLRGEPAVSPVVVNPPPAAEPAPPASVNVTVTPAPAAPEKPCPPAQPAQVTAMAPAPPTTTTARVQPRNLDRGF